MSTGGDEEEILRKLDLRVKEIMRTGHLTVPVNATVLEAARAMETQETSYVFVQSEGKIAGIVTETDIARRVVAKGTPPTQTKIGSVMTTQMIVISPEAKIEEAPNVMIKNRVRRLPVVDAREGLVGIIAVADIARALAEKAGYTSSLITAMLKEGPPPSGLYG